MRTLVVCNVHELRGVRFLCTYIYEDNYVIAQNILPLRDEPIEEKIRTIVIMNCDDVSAFDVHTSTEDVYKACLRAPDIMCHYKAPEETSETIKGFEDERTQAALIDIYGLQEEQPEEVQTKHIPKWRENLISLLRKCIRLLEGKPKGEIKDGMETI